MWVAYIGYVYCKGMRVAYIKKSILKCYESSIIRIFLL